MKKYGKYEKRPEEVPAKQPKAKSELLKAYFTSLLCMVLCVSMFLGTSYAWFTSEVENKKNEIYVGTLKVGLHKQNKQPTGEDDKYLDLADADQKLFDGTARWEPGYTALETLQVTNEGDLAFQYVLSFTEGGVSTADTTQTIADPAQTLGDVAANFEVWVFDHYGKEYVAPTSYDNMKETEGWKMVGTLDKILAGAPVLEGNMNTVRQGDVPDGLTVPAVPGVPDSAATVDTYTVALHMKKDATGEALMGKKITLNVKLVAYQKAQEEDAFGSYDRLVVTPTDLKEALEMGGNVTLLADIKLDETVTIPADKAVTLDLNGHSIVHTGEGEGLPIALTNKGKLTVNGEGTISGGYAGLYSNGELTVNGGTFQSESGFGLMVDNINGTEASVATINGGTFAGFGVYNPTVVTVNGGTFNVGRDPDGASDYLSNKMTLLVSPTFVGAPNTATVTLNGGTFNGDIYVYDDGITETVFENKGATITGTILDNA